jgi:glycosyltransferase involved in cell wall biosynthesis
MRAPISVIIPTLNTTPLLRDTMLSLMEGLDAGLVRELILSDGGSTDGVEKMADFVGAELVTGPAGRGGQLVRGAEVAQGDWLLFLHADTWMPEGWAEETVQHLAQSYERALVYSLSFREAKGIAPKIFAGWANLRTKLFGLPYGNQALLISRELYDGIGGFPDMPVMEDVEIARRLKGRIDLSPLCVRTDPACFQTSGWWRQAGRSLWHLLRFRLGGGAARISKDSRL